MTLSLMVFCWVNILDRKLNIKSNEDNLIRSPQIDVCSFVNLSSTRFRHLFQQYQVESSVVVRVCPRRQQFSQSDVTNKALTPGAFLIAFESFPGFATADTFRTMVVNHTVFSPISMNLEKKNKWETVVVFLGALLRNNLPT